MAFFDALLDAKGVSLGDGFSTGRGKGGRPLASNTKVQFNANLIVGKAYMALLDLEPGDQFERWLGKQEIRLLPIGGSDERDDHKAAGVKNYLDPRE